MTDETYLAETGHRAERKDVLFHLGGKTFTHFHDISLSLIFIALR